MKYDQLREKALANFEALMDFWGIEYQNLGNGEYDFLSPTRADHNFGACRFNVTKGRGADFAGTNLKASDFSMLGLGFTKEDFAGYSDGAETKYGYDIIGLVQRIHKSSSYKDAAARLRVDLSELSKGKVLYVPARNAAERRREEQIARNKKVIEYANKVWKACENIKLTNTPAEKYFQNRGLAPQEQNIRFHPSVRNKELNKAVPTILLKVQKAPDSELVAIHRIYLSEDGSKKANVNNPKMALARIAGSGIWFGAPGSTLTIVEGPENALTARYTYGFDFVVCSINANNFSALSIPPYVKEVILIPDEDEAGRTAAAKAAISYKQQGKKVKHAQLDWSGV